MLIIIGGGHNFTGTNPTSAGRINTGSISNWIILTITANPSTIAPSGTSNITADLLHDNNGTYHNPANGLVPYTGLVTFTTSLGTISNANMSSGLATSKLNAGTVTGAATVTGKIDNATVNTLVNNNTFAVNPELILTTSNTSPNVGVKYYYTITVANNGPGTATGVNGNRSDSIRFNL